MILAGPGLVMAEDEVNPAAEAVVTSDAAAPRESQETLKEKVMAALEAQKEWSVFKKGKGVSRLKYFGVKNYLGPKEGDLFKVVEVDGKYYAQAKTGQLFEEHWENHATFKNNFIPYSQMIAAMDKEIAEKEKEISKMKNDMEQVDVKIEDVERKIRDINESISVLRRIKEPTDRDKDEIDRLESRHKQLKKEIKKEEKESKSLKKEIKKLTKEIASLQAVRKKYPENIKDYKK